MAFNDESDYNKSRINLFDLLPQVFQSDTNRSLFENLFNRFLSKNETVKVSGYVGEGNPTAFLQRQIIEPTPHRQAFQLQPIMYSKVGTVEHMMSFKDVLSELSRLGVDINRMKEWGSAEQFNWAPPIDFDKIINYFDYYWYDPDSSFTSSPQYVTVKNPCATAQSLVTEFEKVINITGEELTIIGVSVADNSITVDTPVAEETFIEGFIFFVRESTNNSINKKYFTVVSSEEIGNTTKIVVQQTITDDSIVDGIVSLAEQLSLLTTARDIACTGGAGWGVGLWDDNQIGTVLWNTALLQAISHPTLDNWIAGNGDPELYDIWYNTTANTLHQYIGGSPANDPNNWVIVQGNFSVILSLATGSVLWDQFVTIDRMNPSIRQWIDENKWLHKNDVPNFSVAKRANLPIIEYYPSVEINEWTYTTYKWKYRVTAFNSWEDVDTEPYLIELLDPEYTTLYYEVDVANRTIILDERYGDLTSNFTPGTSFFIDNSTNNNGAFTVDYTTYAVDTLNDVGTQPYRTRIKVIQPLNAITGPLGSIRPSRTSRGDLFVDFNTHWVFAGVHEVRPIPHQPDNLLLATDPLTNTVGSGYTTTRGPFAQEYILTTNGVSEFILSNATRPASSRTLRTLALTGFNDVRVYKNGVRQYGNYTELTSGSPKFVRGVEFDATGSDTVIGDTIRIEVGESAQDDLGFYQVYVRTDEDEADFLSYGKDPVSLIHYRKEEQVKQVSQQYPLFDMYNLDGTPAYRTSPIFAYGISQEAPIESNTGWRIVKSNDLKNYQFEQFLIDEDDGPMYAYRDYALVSTQYWAKVENLLVNDPSSEAINVHTWLGQTWSKRNLQMNVFYTKPILSLEEPSANAYPQFTTGSPGVLSSGILWYDLESQVLYRRNITSWSELTSVSSQVNDPTITTIWRSGYPNPAIYVPKYVDADRVEVAVGSSTGDWEIPNQLYYNPHHENRKLITLRELSNHFNEVIQAQPQLPGYVGNKSGQWRLLSAPNFGVGGTIHEYNDSYDSFLSATFEKNVTPLSLFEFAHDQYESSLNELKEIYHRNVVSILTNYGLDFFDIGTDVADFVIEQYELDDSRAFVYSDTTAYNGTDGIRNWIATLPIVLLAPRNTPYRIDDDVLGIHEAIHHDTHRSTVSLTRVTTEGIILQTINSPDARAVGETLGKKSSLPPPANTTTFLTYFPLGLRPHVYWYQVSGGSRVLYRLQIKYVQVSSPLGVNPDGAFWFDITNNTLKIRQSGSWVGYETVDVTYIPFIGVIDPAWEILDVNSILTDVILEAERRLYNVSPDVVRPVFDFNSLKQTIPNINLYNTLLEEAFNAYIRQSEIENPYISLYDPLDAFTWNYSTSTFNGLLPYTGYDTSIQGGSYQDLYQKVYGTPYPHLEPWVLQGYSVKPSWWDVEYLNDDFLTYGNRRWKYIHSTTTGMWENIRLGIVPVGYELPDKFTVSTGVPGQLMINGIPIRQYNYMSVNIGDIPVNNGSGSIEPDSLLPPYWDYKTEPNLGPAYLGPIRSLFHILGTEVVGEDENYIFGDVGVVEWEWRNSSQFLYDQLTIAYKMQPIRLLHYTLGVDFLEVGNLQVNRHTSKVYSHRDAQFHGEIYDTNKVLAFNGTLQWYTNYNRYLGYDTNASDFKALWVDWNTPLGYQFGTFLDNTSFFISSGVINITSNDYNITMKRSPGIEDYWIDAFNIAPTRTPPSLLSYATESEWEFSFDTFSTLGRSLTNYAVRRYQFAVDMQTGVCTLYTYSIVAVDSINGIFSISGDQTDVFVEGDQFTINGSTGNDGVWRARRVSYAPGINRTRITIDSAFSGNNTITDITVNGKITATYRTLPWSDGQVVYISTTHTLPSPLVIDRPYYIRIIDSTHFYLMDGRANLGFITPIPVFNTEGIGEHFVGETIASFTALEGANTDTIWYHYAVDTRYINQVLVPKTIKGVQAIIDTLDGIAAWYEQDGFNFNYNKTLIDADTGRLVDWQVEEERFIDSIFQLRKLRNRQVDTYEVSVDVNTNTFTFLTPPPVWNTGTRVSLKSSGVLPSPLISNEGVYIIRSIDDTNQFSIAATLSEAIRNIPLDIMSPGSGTIRIFAKPVSPLAAPRFEVNAFRNSLWFKPEHGIVSDVVRGPYTDIRSSQLFQDQYRRPLRASNLKVFRQDKVTEFRMLPEVSNDVNKQTQTLRVQGLVDAYDYIHMTAGHIFIDGYEHVLLLNDCTIEDNLLYDRFVGVNIRRVDLEFDRQPTFTLRPNLGGYFLSQDSSDPLLENKLVRNIEASAGDMQTFYDTHRAIETLPIMKYSRNLLGYEGIRDDLRQLQVNPKSQFVFWRGMIQYKGTVDPVRAFINSRRFVDARIDEFWAYKVAEFGDAGEQKYPQMRLFTLDARANVLPLHFVVDESETETGFTGVTLSNEERWYNHPDQRATLADNGYLLYFEPTIGNRLDINGPPLTSIIKHNFKSDGVVITFKMHEDGTRTTAVAGPSQVNTLYYIPKTGMLEVFADGVKLQLGVDYTEDTSVPSNRIFVSSGSPTRNIVVVYKSGRLLEGEHYEIVNSNIIQLNSSIISISFEELVLWSVLPNTNVFNPAKVRDILSDVMLYNVTLWDPARGQHYYNAIPEVQLQRPDDPARYTNSLDSTLISTAFWSSPEVGTTWLDTSNLDYIPYYDSKVFTLKDQLAKWGKLADWGEVAVYEWVKSDIPPGDWDDVAEEQVGNLLIVEQERKTGTARSALFSRSRDNYNFSVILKSSAQARVNLSSFYGITSATDITGLIANSVQSFFMEGSPAIFTLLTSQYIPEGNITVTVNGVIQPSGNVIELPSNQFQLTGVDLEVGDKVVAIVTAPIYTTEVIVDGVSYIVRINGNNAQTFGQLITELNNDINGAVVELDNNNHIVITSNTTGLSSSIIINDDLGSPSSTQLFSSLINFLSIEYVDVVGSPSITGSPSISIGTDTVIVSYGHTFANGDTVLVSSTGELPEGLEQGVSYTIENSDYVSGSPEGLGTQFTLQGIELVDIGEGTHTVAATAWPTSWNREVSIKAQFSGLTDVVGPSTSFDLTGTGINVGDIVNVYINGKLASDNVEVDNLIFLVPSVADVDTVTIIRPQHVITDEEADFNPDIEDDGTTHIQYLEDYDHVEVVTLNENTGEEVRVFYFWVRATTTRYNRRALSLAETERQLTTVTAPYMIFRRLESPETRVIEGKEFDLPDRYSQALVRGLRGVINHDDRYILRFTRDFTLRDKLSKGKSSLDLKQLHAEWKLFRQEQLFVVSRYLWDKVTEAMAGYLLTDSNTRVPSLERELYDVTYNTDTRFGLREGQAFVDGGLAKASIYAYLTNPDIDFQPTNIALFFEQESFDTPENIISAMDIIYNTFSYEHTNRIFFSVLHDALSLKVKYPDIFKTSMIALHGIRILEVEGIFDD